MVNPMTRHVFSLISTALVAIVLLGCGGVASNPTAPPFQNPNQPQQPAGQNAPGGPLGPESLFNQLSGGGAATGEQVIQGTFETLWPQGVQDMENGQLMLAAQYFKSAYAQNRESADAAIAYAISDVMRDYRRYAVFLNPGADQLFANTPLIGHPEAFPNPFLTDDSYFLRLAALGYHASKIVTNVRYPTLTPIDSESMFTPANFERFKAMQQGHGAPEETPAPAPGEQNGNPTGPIFGPAQPPGGSGTTPPPGDQERDRAGIDRPDISKLMPVGGKQGDTTLPDTTGTVPGTTGAGGMTTGMTTPPPAPTPPVVLAERENPFSEDEWETMIREYRDAAARDGADLFPSPVFYTNLRQFHDEIKEQIANLEAVKTVAEAEGYALSLSMNVVDGTSKMTFQLDKDDYHLVLDHYRLIDSLLSYAEAYENILPFTLPTDAPKDANNDNVLSPDEYLPPAPFGTLKAENKDALASQLPTFLQSLNGLSNTMKPLLDVARQVQAGDPEKKEIFYLSSFHRNFVLIDQWVTLLRDIADSSTTGTSIKLDSGSGMTEIVAVFDSLFNSPIEDIRLPLPKYNALARDLVLDANGKWSSDPTFGGLFPDGLTDAQTYTKSGRLTCVVYDAQMAKATGDKLTVGLSNADVNDKGLAVIENASVDELVGTPFDVADSTGAKLNSGVVKTLYDVIPLFDTSILSAIFTPTLGGLMTNMGANGVVTTGPMGSGAAPGSSPTGPTSPGGPTSPMPPGSGVVPPGNEPN
jgi:hypothetical protein